MAELQNYVDLTMLVSYIDKLRLGEVICPEFHSYCSPWPWPMLGLCLS